MEHHSLRTSSIVTLTICGAESRPVYRLPSLLDLCHLIDEPLLDLIHMTDLRVKVLIDPAAASPSAATPGTFSVPERIPFC